MNGLSPMLTTTCAPALALALALALAPTLAPIPRGTAEAGIPGVLRLRLRLDPRLCVVGCKPTPSPTHRTQKKVVQMRPCTSCARQGQRPRRTSPFIRFMPLSDAGQSAASLCRSSARPLALLIFWAKVRLSRGGSAAAGQSRRRTARPRWSTALSPRAVDQAGLAGSRVAS